MSFDVLPTSHFLKEVKALAKRYRSIKSDLNDLIDTLEIDPYQGVELAPGVRKIRVAITSKGRGKSGGARVITYTVAYTASVKTGKVYLLDIYDKSVSSTVDISVIKEMIQNLELI